ncbi:hypothetical protein KIW84_035209 [Lathyrus oleraceus]|uniref:Uncharacterized protein n=1 Tax=Pisum sativum TaxID=3888 RepID=A0A9D5B6E2_PEA|nr:hypothetical protein KIW84_035209 [Pisum sativum]
MPLEISIPLAKESLLPVTRGGHFSVEKSVRLWKFLSLLLRSRCYLLHEEEPLLPVARGGRFSVEKFVRLFPSLCLEISLPLAKELLLPVARGDRFSVLALCKNTILFPSWSLAGILRSSFTSQELVSGYVGHQQVGDAGASAPTQSLAIGTPGISTSPLLAEFTGPDGAHALGAVVGDIVSFISMNDRITGSTPGNGSRAAAGEDLVAS